ncbi:MAG: hypothetical protein ACW9WZ_01135 [Nitrosopumilus sp.]|jgi:hypothetical protein
MNEHTRKLIQDYSPMWTNKQIWEFDQINEELRFDLCYVEPKMYTEELWKSKFAYKDSELRDTIVRTFDNLFDGKELYISNVKQMGLNRKFIPYLMAVIVDLTIDEEICLNFKLEGNFLVVSIDEKADLIDCKEFFEEFYHLATGFNYNEYTGIPDDETEAELYLTRLQEEFDEKMKLKLGNNYLPGNNDPDSLHSK